MFKLHRKKDFRISSDAISCQYQASFRCLDFVLARFTGWNATSGGDGLFNNGTKPSSNGVLNRL